MAYPLPANTSRQPVSGRRGTPPATWPAPWPQTPWPAGGEHLGPDAPLRPDNLAGTASPSAANTSDFPLKSAANTSGRRETPPATWLTPRPVTPPAGPSGQKGTLTAEQTPDRPPTPRTLAHRNRSGHYRRHDGDVPPHPSSRVANLRGRPVGRIRPPLPVACSWQHTPAAVRAGHRSPRPS